MKNLAPNDQIQPRAHSKVLYTPDEKRPAAHLGLYMRDAYINNILYEITKCLVSRIDFAIRKDDDDVGRKWILIDNPTL